MTNRKPLLQLIDDPVCATLWYLKRLPLEVAATYLTLLVAHATEQGRLSPEEQQRLFALLSDLLSDPNSRAA